MYREYDDEQDGITLVENLADAAIQTGQTQPGLKAYEAPRSVLVGLSVGL